MIISAKIECGYCENHAMLRMVNDGGGYTAPSYICEDCFAPSDDGPSFDDLPAARLSVMHNGEVIELTGLALDIYQTLTKGYCEEIKAAFQRGFEGGKARVFDTVPFEQRIEWAQDFLKMYADGDRRKLLGGYDFHDVVKHLAAAVQMIEPSFTYANNALFE